MNWALVNDLLMAVQVGVTLDTLRLKMQAAERDGTPPEEVRKQIQELARAKIEEAKKA